MQWQLVTSKKVQKQVDALPSGVRNNLFALMAEIQIYGAPCAATGPTMASCQPGGTIAILRKAAPLMLRFGKKKKQRSI